MWGYLADVRKMSTKQQDAEFFRSLRAPSCSIPTFALLLRNS